MNWFGVKTLSDESQVPVIDIHPSHGWIPVNLRDLWIYRELLYFFTWREIKVRYKQTILGFAWAIIQPVFMMVIFTLFFGNLAKIPSEGIPYPLFNYAALLPWTLFAEGLTRSSNTLVQDANLVRKIYFPRLVMPLSGVISPIVDFAIAFVILIVMMFYYSYAPTARILLLPAFIALAVATAFGAGLWLSALNIKYRDIRYVIPFLVQIWLFASPVVYSSNLLPQQYRIVYALNPMAGVIEGFRWALLGTEPPGSLIAVSAGIVLVILILGVFYFRRCERTFADVS
jgi:lipopolysaccharide transport system permease protein